MGKDKIIYFELNNWMSDDDYPDAEPFISWMDDTYDEDAVGGGSIVWRYSL